MTATQRLNSMDERLENVEKDIKSLKDSSLNQTTILGQMNESLKKLDRGLYGDKDNATHGLIERQERDELALRSMDDRVKALEDVKKGTEAKRAVWAIVIDYGSKAVTALVFLLLVIKGFIGKDSIFEYFFKK